MYDIIFLGPMDRPEFKKLKSKFPTLKRADNLERARKMSFTKFFWIIWDDITVDDNFDFSYEPDSGSTDYIHVFKNGEFFDGICLVPKSTTVSLNEFNYRFFRQKKEVNIVASKPKPFDVFFISYKEPFADENYEKLLVKVPWAKRIQGVKGIHLAHIEAAKQSTTEMFWVVDADALIIESFQFVIDQIAFYDRRARDILKETVHVWRSKNPINDLEYGYGGVKLLPTDLTKNMDLSNLDMTTSISKYFKAMPEISNITAFNTDPFSTWRSAFRECAKLASKIIDRQNEDETNERLQIWQNVGHDKPFGEYAIRGARSGSNFGNLYRDKPDVLKKINDFDWLKEQYDAENF